MTNDEINKKSEEWNKFYNTELGKSFAKYESATISYWRVDADENISMKKLNELDNKMKEARKNFLKLLMSA